MEAEDEHDSVPDANTTILSVVSFDQAQRGRNERRLVSKANEGVRYV